MQAVGDDDGNTTITRPDGSTMVVGPDGKPYIPGSNPNLPQNQDKRTGLQKFVNGVSFGNGVQAPVVPNAKTTSPWQTANGQSQPVQETTGYGELQRILSLVKHR
jgi:hypothetical protein